MTGASVGAVLDSFTGNFTWLPTRSDKPGTYSFVLRATDNGNPSAYAEIKVNIKLYQTQSAPVISSLPLLYSSLIECGDGFFFNVHASYKDLTETQISYSLQGTVPAGASINPVSGSFKWIPVIDQGGEYVITVRAADAEIPALYDERTLTFKVANFKTATEAFIWKEIIQYNTNADFSVIPDEQAIGYRWSVPEGFTIVGGQNTSTINVTSLKGVAIGDIKIAVLYPCGESKPLVKKLKASKASATVILSAIDQQQTVASLLVNVSTVPPNLAIEVLYNGMSTVPSSSGEYVISAFVKDENYEGEATTKLVINIVTSVEKNDYELKVFPNPTSEKITLRFDQQKTADISVTDINGRIIERAKSAGMCELNLASQVPGIYLIKISFANEKIYVIKVLKI